MYSSNYSSNDREANIRFTLRNLIFYLIFLTITSVVIFEMVPDLRFYFTNVLQKQLIDKPFEVKDDTVITFSEIKTPHDFWMYFEKVICDTLYTEFWYGWQDPIIVAKEDDQKILYENKLLGVPRLRQLRVRNDSCKIHEDFMETFTSCYAKFSKNNEDKNTFGLEKETAWLYHNPHEMGISLFYHYGKVATYPTGGYYQDLNLTRQETNDTLNELRNNLWITRHTRVVFLDFTIYNANINLFCIIKLVFEFPPTGGILTSFVFYPANLISYLTVLDFFVLGCEMIVVCFVIYYTYVETQKIIYLKISYFKNWWSYLELIILLGFYMIIGFSIYRYFYVKEQIELGHKYPEKYHSYELVGYLNTLFNNVLAIILFFLWIKVFRFVKLSKTMGQLNSTLSRCAGDIIGFSFMFFIIFFAFSQMGYLLFGAYVENFSTFGKSVLTLLMTVLGEFDYYEIQTTNKIIAPIFFVTYIFLVFFVLFNMFIAIITDTYSAVKEELTLRKSELEISDFLMRAPRNIFRKCMSVKTDDRKLPGNQIIDKIRHVLELCKFTDSEINAFFSMYNINEKELITNEAIQRFLADLKRATNAGHKKKADRQKLRNIVTLEAYLQQQETLSNLEKRVNDLRKKVDEIINKLN